MILKSWKYKKIALFHCLYHCSKLKVGLNGCNFCSTFLLTNVLNECWVCLNRWATLSKALKNFESLSNGSQIKSKFDQTFAQILQDFSFVLKKVGSCQNCLNTSSTFCSTFAQHSFDIGRTNVRQKWKPFKWALPSTLLIRNFSNQNFMWDTLMWNRFRKFTKICT